MKCNPDRYRINPKSSEGGRGQWKSDPRTQRSGVSDRPKKSLTPQCCVRGSDISLL